MFVCVYLLCVYLVCSIVQGVGMDVVQKEEALSVLRPETVQGQSHSIAQLQWVAVHIVICVIGTSEFVKWGRSV